MFFLTLPPPPISTLFPYTTLFRSLCVYLAGVLVFATDWMLALEPTYVSTTYPLLVGSAHVLGAFAVATVLTPPSERSEEHTSELQSRRDLVCRLLLEKKNYRLPCT